MEEHLAIMMADLSGYTALTEVHGAESAAATIDRYMALVNRSLAGDSVLHQRVGDEVMVVASNAIDLAYTATVLFQHAYEENHFLPLHAGLHFGPVLNREGSYFGSAVNLTARITAAAEPGKICCSEAFIQQLPAGHPFNLEAKGPCQFKNVAAPVNLYELSCCSQDMNDGVHIDPVCRMILLPAMHPVHLEHEGRHFYFCSETCRLVFEQSLRNTTA